MYHGQGFVGHKVLAIGHNLEVKQGASIKYLLQLEIVGH